MRNFSRTLTYNDVELDVLFDASPYVPARISGPPEDCYPEEGGEVALTEVYLEGHEILSLLSQVVVDNLESQAYELLPELFEEDPYEPESDDDPFAGDR